MESSPMDGSLKAKESNLAIFAKKGKIKRFYNKKRCVKS
jgi:hypothetical protein